MLRSTLSESTGKIMKMRRPRPILTVLCVCALAGCASKAPNAPTPAAPDSAIVNASFDDAWQAVRQALTNKQFIIDTRDKRGLFVAFEETGRRFLTPHRTKYTIVLESVTTDSTQVTVEAKDQHYKVTLLTYPAWQDTPKQLEGQGAEILQAIESVLSTRTES